MKHVLRICAVIVLFSASIQGVFAATDPIVDFCASPTAQQDSNAVKLCADLKAYQDSASKLSGEKSSIEKDIKVIDGQIQISQQKIKVQQKIIAGLTTDIGAKSKTVTALQTRIDSQVKSISSLLQKVNDRDSTSLPEILLGSRQFADFYTEVDTYATINRSLTALIDDVRSSKEQTETEKASLEDRKDKETDTQAAIAAEQRLIERKKAEKNTLLAAKTADYNVAQKILTEQRQRVAAIRAKLFKFQDGEGIPFGDAYDYAVKIGVQTGVRPAFVLGILMQESSYNQAEGFGTNVGQCFLRDTNTGAGVGANTGTAKIRVMKPDRDVPVFLRLTSDLGRDWMNTRVSCWITAYSGGQPTGWGGAMGPAQFIASTWDNGTSNSIKNRTAKALGLGGGLADPWNPEHAISASSIFLSDLGAGLQTFSAEKNAACQYYSGRKCSSSSAGNTYGTSVMKWVTKIQEEMIDPILGK